MANKIYVWCVATNTGTGLVSGSTSGGDVIGYAMAEDGAGLASHWSSNPSFSKHDMGIRGNWKHDIYKKKYPDEYELEWIDECDLDSHEGWQKAHRLNQEWTANRKLVAKEVKLANEAAPKISPWIEEKN